MLARVVLLQHLEQCQFPLVHISRFAEILKFPSVFLLPSSRFCNTTMEIFFSMRMEGDGPKFP